MNHTRMRRRVRRPQAGAPAKAEGGELVAEKAKGRIAPGLRKFAAPIESLRPDPRNARRHPERNLETIQRSLAQFGQQKPVVVDGKGVIVAGSGLWVAAKALGWKRIAAVRTDLKGARRAGYALADNRTAELAEWDTEALTRQLKDLEKEMALDEIGLGAEDLARLLTPSGFNGLAVSEVPAPDLPAGERGPMRQITFILHERQLEVVEKAVKKAKAAGPFKGSENENSNGNALARIAEAYLG